LYIKFSSDRTDEANNLLMPRIMAFSLQSDQRLASQLQSKTPKFGLMFHSPAIRLAALPEVPPARPESRRRASVTAIAIRQGERAATAAQQQKLLADRLKTQTSGAIGKAIGKLGRTPAAA
jgi:hypothetical protein